MTRYHSEASARILAARQRFLRKLKRWDSGENYYKRKPGDCGQTRCACCHCDKVCEKGPGPLPVRRAALKLREGRAAILA